MKQPRSKTGQFAGYSRRELYEIYLREYARSVDKLEDRGDKMYAERYKSFEEFNTYAVAASNSGFKVNVKFVKDLVADMEYGISRKAAQASAKAYRKYAARDEEFAKMYGSKVSSWEFRQGFKEGGKVEAFFSHLSDEYHMLRSEGYSGKEARKKISRIYFDSKK